jgi:riboflavin kinase/FMN adenylyltransferase
VTLVTADGERVSSSWIRELVRQGEVEHAARLLGRAPWLDGTVVEAYLIGFEGDAYDRPMRVEFTRFLRHELAFETVEELVEQMWRDIESARKLAEEA